MQPSQSLVPQRGELRHPTRRRHNYPFWLRATCCIVPLACVVAISIAAMFGAPIPLAVAASVAGLCAIVIRSVI